MSDTRYEFQCLSDRPKCAEQALFAATEDYTGAVYGEMGRVKYDGTLTDAERSYVEREFGRLTNISDIPGYIKNAKKRFLPPFIRPGTKSTCRQAFRYTKVLSRKFGLAATLGGAYGCGAVYADLYLIRGLESAVAYDPSKWVFFIEEGPTGQLGRRMEEYAYFSRIAEELKIPQHDPVVNIEHPDVLKRAEKDHGIKKVEFVAFQTVSIYRARILDTQGRHLSPADKEAALNLAFRELSKRFLKREFSPAELDGLRLRAKKFGINLDVLISKCGEFFRDPEGKDDVRYFSEKYECERARIMVPIVRISNEMSVERVKAILARENRPYAFFQVGRVHVAIVEEIYGKDVVSPPVK